MSETSTDPKAELVAMTAVNDALAGLDDAQAARVLQWAASARGIGTIIRKAVTASAADGENGGQPPRFETLGDLHAAASPETEADRALVGGYWFQFVEQHPDFAAYEVNAAMKNLGHGLKNITTAFETLKARKPALVIQLKKSGTAKQSRKTYKVTAAGKAAVEAMIAVQH